MKVIPAFLGLFLLFSILASAHPIRDSSALIQVQGFGNELGLSGPARVYLGPPGPAPPVPVLSTLNEVTPETFLVKMKTFPRLYTFWVRFSLINYSGGPLQPFLECGPVDLTTLYILVPGSPPVICQGGTFRTIDPRLPSIERSSQVLPFTLQPGTAVEVYLRIRQLTNEEINFSSITILDRQNLYTAFADSYNRSRSNAILQILFQGFMLCQIGYVLFQWIIIRRREYLYYLFYLALLSLYFLSREESSLGIYFIFSRFPELTIYLNKTLQLLPYFLYFRFVRAFLDLPGKFLILNRWMVRVEYFLLGYLVFDLIFILATLNTRLQVELFLLVISLVFLSAATFIFYLFTKREALTNYILTGSFFIALGNLTGLVISYLQFEAHVNTGITNILVFSEAGVLLEIFCFTSGLSYKSMLNEKEKISSQKKLIEQLQANQDLQSRIQGIRNKIGLDLHDDIGSTLSTILLYANAASRKEDLTHSSVRDLINKIAFSANEMIDEMNDIVWTINPRNDGMEKILHRMQAFASFLLSSNDILFTFQVEEGVSSRHMLMDKKKNFFLIFKEAINNAVKYSRCSEIQTDIHLAGECLEMSIRDNGQGYDPRDHRDGNGLHNMLHRAAEIGGQLEISTSPGAGTTIHLSFSLDSSDV